MAARAGVGGDEGLDEGLVRRSEGLEALEVGGGGDGLGECADALEGGEDACRVVKRDGRASEGGERRESEGGPRESDGEAREEGGRGE